MLKSVLPTAALTGLFCAGFAGVIDSLTEMLTTAHVMSLGAVSGFCGSLFAQLVLRRRRR